MNKEQALCVLKRLEENGFEAFMVGGCVRDWLLDRPVHDIDICTNAHPGDVMRLFPDHVPVGLQHGTVAVKQGGYLFEVTTYRTESGYRDYRRPEQVQFVSDIKEDLARRDFTINAMAMNRSGVIVDPFDGRRDLALRLIRAVGDPLTRFGEDALRLVRAARFAAQLGFRLEAKTMAAIETQAPLLRHIAVERIRDELNKLIDSGSPHTGGEIIITTRLLQAFPLLERLFDQAQPHVWRLTHLGSLRQKWAFLCYAAGLRQEETAELCRLLRFSRRDTTGVLAFVAILHRLTPAWDEPKEVEWGSLLLDYGWDVCIEVDSLLQGIWWNRRDRRSSQALIDTYDSMPVKSVQELAVTGRELQDSLGRKPGEWIGRTLRYLLEQAALHGLANTPEQLLAAAKREVEADEHQTRDP